MKEGRFTFFRQSGWMLIAAVGGGVFMSLVQAAAQQMAKQPNGEGEYGQFAALLNALGQIGIPALGLQSVFAQQAVAAKDEQSRRELAGTVRGVLKVLVSLWLVVAVLVLIFQRKLLTDYGISNPASLWLMLLVALMTMVTSVFAGLLVGQQNFLWFGWASILNGFGRFCAVVVLVVWLHTKAAGAMSGVLAGTIISSALIVWHSQSLWRGEAARFHWGPWLRRVVPLTLGLAAFTYMFTQDMIVVQRHFAASSGEYGATRIVGAALVFLTAPLAQVLFPKIVRSAALSEKTNVLAQALGATGLIGALGATVCTLLPKLPLQILRSPFTESAWLVPYFVWCMLPLAMANVLINNLLARERFVAVPFLLMVAAGYGVTLHYFHPSFTGVIKTLGLFGLILVAVCVVFTILPAKPPLKTP